MAQGVEYDNISILRIDDKYNPYKSQYLKYEKWWTQ